MKISLIKLRNILLASAVLILTFGLGYRSGSMDFANRGNNIGNEQVIGKISPKATVDFSLFWEVWNRLYQYYIDKKALDAQKMVYGAISGMVAALNDPYTVFLPPEQNKEAKDDLGGRFEGIGAQLGIKDKKIVVIAPLKGTPAEKAGLEPGDWILKVDGKETDNWTLPQAVAKIRGPKGSKVVLTIMHQSASTSSDISVIRDEIKVASVEWEVKKAKCNPEEKCREIKEECFDCEKIIYLKLSRFGDQTNDEWNRAVDEIAGVVSKTRIKGLVFDLRNNPGGYLSGSVFIASEFLSNGPVVIQQQSNGEEQVYSVNRKGRLLSLPMIVLINKGSASASEIVSGALQEKGRAKLVGETSFGKGSIQEAQELSGGSGLHITTAKWLLPSKKWINGTGVEPNIKVENDLNKPEEDLQLEKAIELLIK